VCFGAVEGYTTPQCQNVTLTEGQTTTVTGTFTQRGFLHVTTSPPVAGTITVDGVPRDDWGLWTDFPTGSHLVCFGLVADFTPPACQNVNVTAGQTTDVTGVYTPFAGAPGPIGNGELRVETSPEVPSQITIDGNIADTWGVEWVKLTPGPHEVCFRRVEGYTTPACQNVNVNAGETTTVTGTFTQRGFLRVLTSPALPGTISAAGIVRNDWGMWTDVPTGSYQVCFGFVPGKSGTPACRNVNVVAGATATTTGNYT
jgi:hypothetical protein